MQDLISRHAAIDALCKQCTVDRPETCSTIQKGDKWCEEVYTLLKLPSAQPDIIQCRNCKFASGDSRICMKFGHSPIGELDFCSFAERREVTT